MQTFKLNIPDENPKTFTHSRYRLHIYEINKWIFFFNLYAVFSFFIRFISNNCYKENVLDAAFLWIIASYD